MKRPTECLPESENIKCNHDRDVDEKKNPGYLTDESGDTLKLLRLFISVKISEKLSFGQSGKF